MVPQGSLAREMDEMAQSGDGYSFSSQQMYSYRNDGNGDPQEFQAISSTAKGPGGVRALYCYVNPVSDHVIQN